jgi:hypothetical protein
VAGLLAAAVVLSASPVPASAAGLFESFFGELGRALGGAAPRQARAYADPSATQSTRQERIIGRSTAGPRQAFCVRTCDGGYFPVHAHAGLSAADACRSFCPACETQLYYGSTIDYAVARDGSRYTDLPNAYLYRKQVVAGCHCNGRGTAGVAAIAPRSDPTLRRGDVVVTSKGLMVYNGSHGQAKNFTPVQSYPGFSRRTRAKLSKLKVTPPDRRGKTAAMMTPVPAAAWDFHRNRTAQR